MDNVTFQAIIQDMREQADSPPQGGFQIEATLSDGDPVFGVPRFVGINIIALDNPGHRTFYVPLSAIICVTRPR